MARPPLGRGGACFWGDW